MPNDYAQHRLNQYGQKVCHTNEFLSFCRKNKLGGSLKYVDNALCRCPSSKDRCLYEPIKNECRSQYASGKYQSSGEEFTTIHIKYKYPDRHVSYYCPCPRNPCASKDFYHQCRNYESKNMHPMDVVSANLSFNPNNYPMKYPETAKLIGLPK